MSDEKINKENIEENDIEETDSLEEEMVVEEDNENEVAGADAKKTIHNLRERLKQAESDKLEYLTGWQKTKADYVNSRKNDEIDRQAFIKFAEAGVIVDLLPVLDSFELAFSREKEWGNLPEEWQKGMKNIFNQFFSTLEARGLKQINPFGETFNPNTHDAIANVQTDKKAEDHKVLDVVQKGYTLHDKLLRTARVRVGEYISG